MTRFSVAAVFSVMVLGASAFAQTPPPATAVPPQQAPLRMAFLDLQRIAAESTEGKAASSKVQALTQKKSTELQDKTKSLQSNQQKLQQGGAVLNEAARAQTQREIDRLTVEIDRFQEDANAEVQELQQSPAGRVPGEAAPGRRCRREGAGDRPALQRGRRRRDLRRSVARHHRRSDQAVRLGQILDGREAGRTGDRETGAGAKHRRSRPLPPAAPPAVAASRRCRRRRRRNPRPRRRQNRSAR